jgi:hypothetical protein
MVDFVETVAACGRLGVRKVLRAPRNLAELQIANNYTLARWMKDPTVSREHVRLVQVWATKAPYLEDLIERLPRDPLTDVLFRGTHADALQCAYVMDGLSISISSDDPWNGPYIELVEQTISDDGNIVDRRVQVHHGSRPAHIAEHETWIKTQRLPDVANGKDLWDRRADIFDYLDFSASVSDSLIGLSENDPKLRLALSGLTDLETCCARWDEIKGGFDSSQLNASPESPATLRKFGEHREFTCPDGIKRQFSWHLKKNTTRIYFMPIPETRRMTIGYIGKHLPTKQFPN